MNKREQWRNQIFSPRHQRMLGVAVGILLQMVVFTVLLRSASQYFVYFYWFCLLVSLVVSLYISTTRTRLAYKMAWIIPILVFPLVGGMMFLILGGARKPHYNKARADRIYKKTLPHTLSTTDLLAYGADATQQAWYLANTAHCPAYRNTETRYYPTGESFLPVFLETLRGATDYIFLEYFIIAEGMLWQDVLDILAEKAAAGVDVRIIYDGIGSAPTLPADYARTLEKLGIQCRPYAPLRPVLSIHQNNRDHRKLCVVDGTEGFVSGLNLADEYVGRLIRFGTWKDNALFLRGPAVWSLTVFFLTMWDAEGPADVEPSDYTLFRPRACPVTGPSEGVVIPYADTPLAGDTVCADLHLLMITKARRYLYLTTPYLIIDETMNAALCTAARSGVDVRIMTPHVPDKKSVFAVTQGNYTVLLEAGVRIFEYTPGFLHSKTVVADDLYASVGSCNLDYRSFYLQFENGVWMCGDPSVLDVRDDFLKTSEVCQEITLQDKRPLRKRLQFCIYRIFSPLF